MLWTTTIGGPFSDIGHSVIQVSPGNYVISGETRSYGIGDEDIWLLKVAVLPVPIISSDSILIDIDRDGFEEVNLGNESYHPEGASIVSYSWIVDDSEIGVNPQESIILPTGSHQVTLKVTDQNGLSDSVSTVINVLVFKIQTE